MSSYKSYHISKSPFSLLLAVLLCCYGLAHTAFAQPATPPTMLRLEQALQEMEANYPQLQLYDYRLQAAEARVSGARSWMPPIATFGLSRMPYNPRMLDMPIMENQSGLMIGVEQMIPNPSAQRARQRYIEAQKPAIRQQKAWTLNQLRAETRQLYYNRYIAEKMLQVIGKSEQILELLLQNAEASYAYNQSSLLNIYSARARLEELRNQRLLQRQMIAESNLGLTTLMGRSASAEFAIDTVSQPGGLGLLAVVADTALAARSDIAAMESNILAMQANRELMRTDLKPTFGVRFEHMPMFNMESMYSVMGMVTLPFVPWASRMTKAETRAMDLDIRSMRSEIQTMQLMQSRMVAEKRALWQMEQERLQNYREKVLPAYRKALDVSLLAYRNNTVDLFRVLEAWEMWQMKEMEYYKLLERALKLEVEYARELEK